jgi:hypothetical protein
MGLFDWLRGSTKPTVSPPATVTPPRVIVTPRPEIRVYRPSPTRTEYESNYLHSSRWDELLAPTDGLPNLQLSEYRGELWLMETTTSKLVKVGNRHLAQLGIWTATVRGVDHYQSAVKAADTSPGQSLQVVREPDNAYDRNAVGVHSGGQLIGYFNKQMASKLAKVMDSGMTLQAISLAGSTKGQGDSRIQILAAEPTLLRHIRGARR